MAERICLLGKYDFSVTSTSHLCVCSCRCAPSLRGYGKYGAGVGGGPVGWKGQCGGASALPCRESGQTGARTDPGTAGEVVREDEQHEHGTLTAPGQCQQHTQPAGTSTSLLLSRILVCFTIILDFIFFIFCLHIVFCKYVGCTFRLTCECACLCLYSRMLVL